MKFCSTTEDLKHKNKSQRDQEGRKNKKKLQIRMDMEMYGGKGSSTRFNTCNLRVTIS